MNLNPLKCELLCISNKLLPPKFDYVLNGFPLKWCTSVRYLGVHINSKLSWNDNCSIIAAKATRVLNFLRRTMFSCSRDSKYRSFRSFVLPTLEYACQAWNPHTQKCIRQLESIFSVVVQSGFVEHSMIFQTLPRHHYHPNVVQS